MLKNMFSDINDSIFPYFLALYYIFILILQSKIKLTTNNERTKE